VQEFSSEQTRLQLKRTKKRKRRKVSKWLNVARIVSLSSAVATDVPGWVSSYCILWKIIHLETSLLKSKSPLMDRVKLKRNLYSSFHSLVTI
jgi:hypothetical protein